MLDGGLNHAIVVQRENNTTDNKVNNIINQIKQNRKMLKGKSMHT